MGVTVNHWLVEFDPQMRSHLKGVVMDCAWHGLSSGASCSKCDSNWRAGYSESGKELTEQEKQAWEKERSREIGRIIGKCG